MKQNLKYRPAVAALFAAAVFSTAPVFAQTTTTAATPPPVVNIAPPPPSLTPAPAPAPAPAPPRVVNTAPPAAEPAPARTVTPAPRTVSRSTTVRTRQAAPVRQAAPERAAPAPAPVQAQPVPEAAPAPPPVAELPPAPAPVTDAVPAPVEETSPSIWPWLLGGAALLILFALFMRNRRRGDDEVFEEAAYEEPVVERTEPVAREYQPTIVAPQPIIARPGASPAPIAAAPAAVAVAEAAPDSDAVSVTESDSPEMETLAEGSEAPANRPWIELLMKPVRAGTSQDDAIVQFELTVGNTGAVDAKDVRISTWMFAAGSARESDMERMLISPPADATVSNIDIDAGEGAKVEAEIMLSTAGLSDTVLPVVVADARYRLPDGSEGRTSASFAIGLPDGDELNPFPTDRASGLRENAEARLHGEPQRV